MRRQERTIPTVEAALEAVDKAFAALGRRGVGPVDACSHCFSAEDLRLLAGPADGIDYRLMIAAIFDWNAGTFDRHVPFWRMLTPRILRGLEDGTLHIDEALVAKKFFEAEWPHWPPREADAVTDYLRARLHCALTSDDGDAQWELVFASLMTRDLTPWLTQWTATPGPQAAHRLSALWEAWLDDLVDGELTPGFYAELGNIAPVVGQWLKAEAARRIAAGELAVDDVAGLEDLILAEDAWNPILRP